MLTGNSSVVLPIASNMCHVYRFQRSCLCMYANCLFILRFVYVFILLYSSGMSRHISFLSPFYIVFQTHIHFFNVICHGCAVNIPHSLYKQYTRILYIFIAPPPRLLGTMPNIGQFCTKVPASKTPVLPGASRNTGVALISVRCTQIYDNAAPCGQTIIFGIRYSGS